MTNIEISFDPDTGYYDACVLEKWVATQGKSLDTLVSNIWSALQLSQGENFALTQFNISFDEKYVNI